MWARDYWIDEDEPSRAARLTAGFAVGLATGIVTGLLLAPAPGAVLRRQVRSSARRSGRRAAEAYDGVSQAVGDGAARRRRDIEKDHQILPTARSAEPSRDAARVPLP